MGEPLIDLTQPPPAKPRRPSAPKPPARAKVERPRTPSPRAETPPSKDQKIQAIRYWLESSTDDGFNTYYAKALSFGAGTDLTQIHGVTATGERDPEPIFDKLKFQGKKSLWAAKAAVELEEAPPVKWIADKVGPVAPYLFAGGVLIMVGLDVVAVLKIRAVIKSAGIQEAAPAAGIATPAVPEAPTPNGAVDPALTAALGETPAA